MLGPNSLSGSELDILQVQQRTLQNEKTAVQARA
jgi:hypothetical protein